MVNGWERKGAVQANLETERETREFGDREENARRVLAYLARPVHLLVLGGLVVHVLRHADNVLVVGCWVVGRGGQPCQGLARPPAQGRQTSASIITGD